MKKYIPILILIVLSLFACNKKLYKAIEELKNTTAPDYSYVVEPVFKETKELLQEKTKNTFNADEVRIGAVGFHKYDTETKGQKDEVFRLQTVILNSKSITDFQNDSKMHDLGKEVAKFVTGNILNSEKYDKIEVSFILQEKNSAQLNRLNTFFRLPNFEPTTMFDK